jgi:hypothetical protein
VAGSGSLRVDRGGGGLTSRSTAGGVSGGGGVSQMSGVEVYMQNTLGGGKAGKGEQILNVVTGKSAEFGDLRGLDLAVHLSS